MKQLRELTIMDSTQNDMFEILPALPALDKLEVIYTTSDAPILDSDVCPVAFRSELKSLHIRYDRPPTTRSRQISHSYMMSELLLQLPNFPCLVDLEIVCFSSPWTIIRGGRPQRDMFGCLKAMCDRKDFKMLKLRLCFDENVQLNEGKEHWISRCEDVLKKMDPRVNFSFAVIEKKESESDETESEYYD